MSENRCVCCGDIIPEGSMVCVSCQRKADERERVRKDVRVHRKDVGCLDRKGVN